MEMALVMQIEDSELYTALGNEMEKHGMRMKEGANGQPASVGIPGKPRNIITRENGDVTCVDVFVQVWESYRSYRLSFTVDQLIWLLP